MSNPKVFDYTKDPKFQYDSKFRSEDCNKTQQNSDNKSIFKYITDNSMFVNNNNCLDDTPAFLPYIQSGIPLQSIDIENDLRGVNRPNTRCSSKKWQSPDTQLIETVSKVPVDMYPNNKPLCKEDQKILPNGYFKDPMLRWNGLEFVMYK